ncbi:MAG: SDR family NAD(P)-dependent oxidoreductase [Myxococcota bacterium]
MVDPPRYGPTALVVGAAQGLGRAFSRELHRAGFDLVLVDREAEALRRLARETGAQAVLTDLGDPAALESMLADLPVERVGLLVYNAAQATRGPFEEMSAALLDRHLQVNCRGPLLCARAVLPGMVARGRGGVVLLSSMVAFFGAPGLGPYAASRGFTLALGESLAAELADTGVDVLVGCPGATDTDGFRASHPDPEEVAKMRLASPEATAREILGAVGRRAVHVCGRRNRLGFHLLQRLLPRRLATSTIASHLERLYGPLSRR